MDQNSVPKRLKDYAWPLAIGIAVTLATAAISAIVVISPRLASVETPTTVDIDNIPPQLAGLILPPKPSGGAFDTPFFNAKEEPLTVATFKGQGVVLNLWATWCAPCVREMPALDRLSAQLKSRGVHVVALSEDRKAMKKVPPFYAANKIEHLDFYYDVKSQVSRELGVAGLPTTLLIAADGREVGRVKGALEWDHPAIVEFLAATLGPQ